MTALDTRPVDMDTLMKFVFRAVDEVGATLNTAMVVMGDRLGWYRAMAGAGPLTPSDLAVRTDTAERYVREWLNAQAAGGFVEYDPDSGRYTLPPEQAVALTDESSPAFLPGFFELALGSVLATSTIAEAARTGTGYGWHEQAHEVHEGCERFVRPGYNAHLIAEWLPALDGVVDRLQHGGTVADVGCGHGASTVLMAQEFPASTFVGTDYHAASVDAAREAAATAGTGNTSFEVAAADGFTGGPYDLITFFDCLHDMGDPVGALRHARTQLADDGVVMLVEPQAGDSVADNLNPVGRVFYAASSLICTPASQSQDVGLALGAQAGPARLAEVARAAGFTRVRTAAENPFNQVLELRR